MHTLWKHVKCVWCANATVRNHACWVVTISQSLPKKLPLLWEEPLVFERTLRWTGLLIPVGVAAWPEGDSDLRWVALHLTLRGITMGHWTVVNWRRHNVEEEWFSLFIWRSKKNLTTTVDGFSSSTKTEMFIVIVLLEASNYVVGWCRPWQMVPNHDIKRTLNHPRKNSCFNFPRKPIFLTKLHLLFQRKTWKKTQPSIGRHRVQLTRKSQIHNPKKVILIAGPGPRAQWSDKGPLCPKIYMVLLGLNFCHKWSDMGAYENNCYL